jgi:acetyl esterase/lipase
MSTLSRSVLAAVLAVGCNAPIEIDDVSYDDRHGSATTMDFYLPDDGEVLRPTVMFIHGGGWVGGDKSHAINIGPRLARSGYVVASINYRLVPAGVFPNNAIDCICALAFLRAHADEYGIDPDRIAVVGYSAGAHLGGIVGLASDHPELPADCEAAGGQPVAAPASVVAASGAQDMFEFYDWVNDKQSVRDIFGGSPTQLPHAYELGSPIWHVRAGAPPFLLMNDAIDFGGIEAMRNALVSAGSDARLLRVAGAAHILVQHDEPGVYEGGMTIETPEAWIAMGDFLARTIGRGH